MRCRGIRRVESRPFNLHFSPRNLITVKEVAMPTAAKKRKITAGAQHRIIAHDFQGGIQAFGKISKARLGTFAKTTAAKANGLSIADNKCGDDKKRKLDCTDLVSQPDYDRKRLCNPEAPISFGSEGPAVLPLQETTGRSSLPGNVPGQKGAQTTSSSKSQKLQPSTPSTCCPSPVAKPSDDLLPPSKSETDSCLDSDTHQLPEELLEYISLHSSFLTVLSLHYAHNGSLTPADLRNITPTIERAWKRRRVLAEDIQRLLAVEQGSLNNGKETVGPLFLSNYGHGKVCVEILGCQHSGEAQKRPLDEEHLNMRFLKNIKQQWLYYNSTVSHNPSPTAFISSLPLLPIKRCASLSKLSPLISKGQRRLEDLKTTAIKAQKSPLQTSTANSSPLSRQPAEKTMVRSIDLFSRLKAKQLYQSTLPLPPSSETLARKSALQRLPEIAPVLQSLAVSSKKHCNNDAIREVGNTNKAHISFTMPTLVQHLQMSSRNPVGNEEAARCVKLLEDVTPEWISVKKVGKAICVTVRGEGIGRDELGGRVKRLIDLLE